MIVEKADMEPRTETAKRVITFLGLTTAATTGIFLWMFAGAKDNMAVVFLMMWTPGISAVLASVIYGDGIGDYGWKPGRLRFLAYGYFLPLVVSIVGYGIVWLGGYAEFTTTEVSNYRWARMLGFELPAPFVVGVLSKMTLGFLVTLIFVLGEEIGWSGFLTPRLLKLTTVSVTSLIVGSYWAV